MTFANGWVLHFLWILPIAAFALIGQNRRRQWAMEQFAEPTLLARLTLSDHKGKRFVKGILFFGALGATVLALSGPRWGNRYQEVSRKGVDIMVLVDVSRSMMVEDVTPNRMERARREIIDFLKIVEGDRVGLTAFAGAAFVQCPLTLDYAALEMFLNALQPGLIPVSGTDMGAAIETGLSAFDLKAETDKVMLLITDGEDNEHQGQKAAQKAARQGIKIFVFGMGESSGGPIPAEDGKGGFKKDKDGQLVLSRLDEKTLQDLASVTGGGYVRSVAGDLDLDMLYFEGIKQKTKAQTLKSGKIKVYEERFNVFVWAAFLLLLLEGLLDEKRRPVSKKRFGFLIGLAISSLVPLLMTNSVFAAGLPDELYRHGQYEEAGKAYAAKDMDHPKDTRYRYNRGCAAFHAGQYSEASAAFSSVMRRTQDRNVRFMAAYNLGNTTFKQGDYESAAAYYKQALSEDPTSQEARYNLELSLRAIEQMKQKQPEAPKTSPEMDDHKEKGDEEKDSGKNGQPQNQGTQKRDPANVDPHNDENGKRPDDSKPENTETLGGNQNQKSTRNEKPEPDMDKNLPGELKPLHALSELKKKKEEPGADQSVADKKRAEALLDNVQENPSGILRFMVPEKNLHGAASGRDW